MGGIRTRIDLFSAAAVAFEGFQLYMYRGMEMERKNDTRRSHFAFGGGEKLNLLYFNIIYIIYRYKISYMEKMMSLSSVFFLI